MAVKPLKILFSSSLASPSSELSAICPRSSFFWNNIFWCPRFLMQDLTLEYLEYLQKKIEFFPRFWPRSSADLFQIIKLWYNLCNFKCVFFTPCVFGLWGFRAMGGSLKILINNIYKKIWTFINWFFDLLIWCEILWNIWYGYFGLLYTPFYHSLRSGSDIITCRRRRFSIAIEVSLRTIGYCALS